MAADGKPRPVRSLGHPAADAVVDWLLEPNYFDSRTQGWPLVSWQAGLTVVLLYVCGVPLLQKFMAGRKPFSLKTFSMCHNAFMVALSAYMMVESIDARYWCFDRWPYPWGTMLRPADTFSPQCARLANVLWVHYVSKIYEFTDTLIMVLRKNDRQVTFLHLYHHATIFICWWIGMNFSPGGDAYFICAVNSFVHVLMYTYYLVASLKLFRVPQAVKKSITILQLTQFASFIAHALYGVFLCPWFRPRAGVVMVLAQAVIFWLLFFSFFRHTYTASPKKQSAAKAIDVNSVVANGCAHKQA